MKKNAKLVPALVTILITIFFFVVLFPSFKSQAGALGETYLYLSRIKTNLNGASGNEVEMILAFEPSQSFLEVNDVVATISFPMADNGQWCRTPGALTVTGVSSAPTDITGWAISLALPGATGGLSATCTQGNGTTTVDTITISNIADLNNTQIYGVQLSNSTGILGTSTTSGSRTIAVQISDNNNLDTKAFGVFLLTEDTVHVQATISAAPTITCTLSPTSINLGTLYPGGGLATLISSGQISTSSTNSGYYWAAYGRGNGTNAGLWSGVHLIQSGTGTGTVDISAGGSEGFGITLTQPTGATVTTDFVAGTPGLFGSLGANPSGARLVLYKSTETSPAQSSNVAYGARAGSGAPSGTYNEYITYVCGGYY
jgi:hypothetical protein